MSGSDNGTNGPDARPVVSPSRVLGARSASPAKRSAADMEAGDKSAGAKAPGSFTKAHDETSQFDEVMKEISSPPAAGDAMDTQETVSNGVDISAQGSMTTNTSATSLDSDTPPDGGRPSIDEQVREVTQLLEQSLDEGQQGYVVSWKWLGRVMARSSDGRTRTEFPKEAREGPIGPVDNSDILPDGAYAEPLLKDAQGQVFIPLKPGLTINEDFQILPYKAWGLIAGWYGTTLHQKPIVRYAHNTAPPDATHPNIIYEIYPPIITVRKVPQSNQEGEQQPVRHEFSITKLRLKDERRARGQMSPNDAIQFVCSRSEKFQAFLTRSKQAADIPLERKVKIWKLLDPSKVAIDKPDNRQNGVLSPPESRSGSPKAARAPESKLVLDLATFNQMEVGKDLEPIDGKDETGNSNYNGKSTLELYQLFEDTTVVLEEQIGGPAGGEFASDSKKLSTKLGLTKKNIGSRPGSTTASGRTSPAPGGGMMTRGRQRRDGRTRGTVGLTNLGNTCYMNSALQCIRSVEELAIYFLSGKHKLEINTDNPLGHNGVMAKRYFEVLESIYTNTSTSAVTPSAFKKTLGSIQPLFSGYGQQDSQEFLSFLVDALHEDLNRIIKKPYIENPDSDDKTVHDPQAIIELGETYRTNHAKRNDSVAMDLFSGFYKNTMECPVCDKISITFDPFSLVTVQLPIENTFQHTITFVPIRGRPVNHSIDIDKNSTIKMLKENIASKHPGVKADRLWMTEVYSHKIYKVFENSTTLGEASIQTNDYLFVFELEDVPTNSPSPPEKKSFYSYSSWNKEEKAPEMDDAKADKFAVPVFSRQRGRFGNGHEVTLHPMYITLTRDEAQNIDIIMKKCLLAASNLTSRQMLTELGSNQSTPDADMKDQSPPEDHAQISDSSVTSEDGYVEVSVDKSAPDHEMNGVIHAETGNEDIPIPKGFMDSQYVLSDALLTQLFTLKYAQSENGGLHCSGMASIKDTSIRDMAPRVKQRRSSVQSDSGEETASTGSGPQANGETDESEDDNMDTPDLVLGGQESSLGLPGIEDSDDDQSLPENPLMPPTSRKGRRKNGKGGKKGRRPPKTYGKKGRGLYDNRPNDTGTQSAQFHRGLGGKSPPQDDNPYYIKLGEGIVLDWFPEAFDALFGGDRNDEEEMRGHFMSTPDGRNVPFINDPEVEDRKTRRETRKKNGITLNDCFVETGKREVLSEDNAWYCNRCKELRRATKTLEIWTIPDILVVHLKRFGGNRSFRDKIDVLVDYPIEGLDMTDRIGLKEDGKEYVYDLFAVDNHYGGLGGGHYTAMAKNFYDGQWYDYNDSSCSKLSENRLKSAAAYLLFYRRRSDKPLGPQYLQDLVLEARNPPPEAAAEETAEESDSGEGRLGGPNGSLLGSSSALIGAGVDPASLHVDAGGVGAGTPASNNLITRTSNPYDGGAIGMLHGEPMFGPQRPSAPADLLQFREDSSWGFDTLDNVPGLHDEAADTLIDNVADDDAASTTAEMDTSIDPSLENDLEWNGFEDNNNNDWSAGRNTPVVSDEDTWTADYHDDHQMYSASHEQSAELETLQIEDAAAAAASDKSVADSPVVEIELSPTQEHVKMD